MAANPISTVDTGRKLNVHKTFRRRPGRLLNEFCTFNLRTVSTGSNTCKFVKLLQPNFSGEDGSRNPHCSGSEIMTEIC